jgi:putative ABC transport system permease protein
MIGVAVVALVTMLAAGLKASFSGAFEDAIEADLVVVPQTGQTPPAVREQIARIPGVAAASPLPFTEAQLVEGREDVTVGGLDPATAPQVIRVPWTDGSDATLRELGADGALVNEGFAEEQGLRVGSTFEVRTPTDELVALTVRGTYDDSSGLFEPITLADATLRERFGVRQDGALLLAVADGQDVAAVQRQVNGVLERDFPTLESQTGEEFIDEAVGQVDQIVNLLYALLSLAVLIALLGIANTLALSIYERTRELGLLRAIGASRRQVRRMVRGEALITALIGASIGVVVGIAFAALISIPLSDEGFTLSFPVGTLLVVLVLAALCGVLAALNPARRAAKTDILGALKYE